MQRILARSSEHILPLIPSAPLVIVRTPLKFQNKNIFTAIFVRFNRTRCENASDRKLETLGKSVNKTGTDRIFERRH